MLFFSEGFSQESLGSSVPANEIHSFATSKAWLKLLSYQQRGEKKFRSLVYHQEFFISAQGKTDPYAEAHAYIRALEAESPQLYGFVKATLPCAFPARYQLARNYWPKHFKEVHCPQFAEWQDNLSLGDAYLVYSSSYPNNPASLFGHTFLRFDRKRKNLRQGSSELLGYSVGFLAVTDPNDNPLLYTFKGITGQYLGSFQLRPHYVNIGIYNNGESRDLWEYGLNLTAEEISYFEKVLYEQVLGPGYQYYFFDDNCAFYLLNLLEMVRPELEFSSKNKLAVLPHETVKEVVDKYSASLSHYRPSLSKVIDWRINGLTFSQMMNYRRAMNSQNQWAMNDPDLIDVLVDGMREKNYQKKTLLTIAEKKQMQDILEMRSEMSMTTEEKQAPIDENKPFAPHLAHKSKRLQFVGDSDSSGFSLAYGLHHRTDALAGFDPYSFINYLQLVVERREEQFRLGDFQFIAIESLTPFSLARPRISWSASFDFLHPIASGGMMPQFDGGVGITLSSMNAHALFTLFFHAIEAYHLPNSMNHFTLTLSPQLTLRNTIGAIDVALIYGKKLENRKAELMGLKPTVKWQLSNQFALMVSGNYDVHYPELNFTRVGIDWRF